MENKNTNPNDYDSPWKEAVERYFKEFSALLFPHVHDEIDWTQKPVFIDKELQKLVWNSETGRRYADKLVKVRTKRNKEIRVIIHIEVQGEPEEVFSERMFIYYISIFRHHRTDVVSLGVLTDNKKSFRPDSYSRALWGCKLDFCFPIAKLQDWEDKWDVLENSDNVFALVVMAQIKAKTSRTADELKAWKFHLVRLMYERSYDREGIQELFRYIDWMIRLPVDLERQFLEDVYRMEEEKEMPYITSAERFGMYNEKIQTIMRFSKLNLKPEDIAAGVGLTPEKVRAILEAKEKGLDILMNEDTAKQ
ncbi:hypothetical protein [Desulfobotulus sp.]|uniref:hypothetical protein n=1 Tax=Desulfobotulus sp. TaxID=1940337 RepID=UPI002A360B90|nr:hypothetical protein [Desulfobotulus sp.]MDY0164436.1 hypothetical protein [Desulfobotulus sp.]